MRGLLSPLFVRRFVRFFAILSFASFTFPYTADAQTSTTRLITQPVDESKLVTLHGTVHPLAQSSADARKVADSFAAHRMLLILNRPPDRESALHQFLSDAHTKGSPSYHRWITPEEFGAKFGPADADVQAVWSWLASHGFAVARTAKSKRYIEFSGTAGQVREAFHTQIHQYNVGGEVHYANATEVAIPEALAALVRGVSPLNNFRAQPNLAVAGPALYSRSNEKTTPLWTLPNSFGTSNPNIYAVAPEDFATQYDLGPLYSAGVNGVGQTIGIINESNIDVSLANNYRQLFNLSNNPTQVVVDGEDPGSLPGIDVEAYLDVEVSGSVAPGATINLYISGGSDLQDPLVLAALRAIEDNQASVLSVSFGECESSLGPNGNELWSSLWEQAAAQGQTVLVSTGDTGSECLFPFFLSVSGLASTPWNVAVGGTDFFYSDFASGGASATTLWNMTNDANLGSLKATLPEQVWNDALGLNIISDGLQRGEIDAGGGGPSTCASAGPNDTCAPTPKPLWQTGPGVPADGARDTPDVSLFASNGANLSAYPICAAAGDCAPGSGDQAKIFLVGGTSASTPAMAGIMALVSQKYGRQGQADFTLYPLAQQKPAAFHDVTKGSNDEICEVGTGGCMSGATTLYPAGPTYDLASGLGSVDANVLVNDWNSVTFQGTTTTLELSSAHTTHGQPVTVAAKVAPGSGGGTPTGSVAIVTNSPTIASQGQVSFPLTEGSGGGSVNFLPGGSYEVTAKYSGDGIFGASTSSPVTLTVKAEGSNINFGVFNSGQIPITSGSTSTAMYGQPLFLEVQPSGSKTPAGMSDGIATGNATFTLDSATATVPLNANGIANWTPSALSVGMHTASAMYSGDASFEASASTPVTFAVAKGFPGINIFESVANGNESQLGISINTGGSLTVTVIVNSFLAVLPAGQGTPPGIAAPTGTVNVCLDLPQLACNNIVISQTLTLASPTGANSQQSAGTVTFTNLPAGQYFLSAVYAGDANWNSVQEVIADPITVSSPPVNPRATTTTLTITPSSISGTQLATVTATVAGASGATIAPTGTVSFYDNSGSSNSFFLNTLAPATNGATASFTGKYSTDFFWNNGANQIVAVYSGDANYQASSSAATSIQVMQAPGDFTLAPQLAQVTVASGGSANAGLNLTAVNESAGTVGLSCTPSSAAFGCSINPTSVTANGAITATLTVNAFAPAQAAGLPVPRIGVRNRAIAVAGFSFAAILVLLGFSGGRRRLIFAATLALFSILAFQAACGGGSGGGGGGGNPPPPSSTPTPAGTYSVLVTAAANGTIHNVKIAVVVN